MKREPVAIYAAVVAALTAFLGVAGLTERVPENVVFWLGVVLAVLTAVGGVVVRGQVTPLADPTEKDGRPLAKIYVDKGSGPWKRVDQVAYPEGVTADQVLAELAERDKLGRDR